jgi:hypothetical protein
LTVSSPFALAIAWRDLNEIGLAFPDRAHPVAAR